ncbi:hypothetical protein MOMA_06896 [Moraxella macacae 0408225]|uniref:Uncharacterized protein n=1 Tax=Moraxella macacae 0408225 TaxID=1230338 RepID=L2F5D8_9GAMM|nr:hypothetical protein [Moraxella macacae]ELA08269.1 hypothetical protein MOMA_06896 [Moraxella macacae 0408225]
MTLTLDVLKRALPRKYENRISQEVLDNINNAINDPDNHTAYRDNFLGYSEVLNDGRYSIDEYLNAVKYCTHKLMGSTNIDSYIKTFPDRYQSMVNKGYSAKEMSSHIAMYNKSQLVNKIMEQSMIPSWIINQDLYQKAINVQAELMMTANSEKVRSDAANSLLIHLKPPEVKKVELDIGLKNNDEIQQLRDITAQLASQQKRMIEAGVIDVKQVAETKLIAEVISDE